MSYSDFNYSFTTATITLNSNTNNTLIENASSYPYDDKLIMGLIYFGVSLIFGVPVLMILICVYKMRGDPPCNNVKQACCCEFC